MRARHRRLASGTLIRIVLMVIILSSVAAVQPGTGAAQDAEPTATEVATQTAAPEETPAAEVTPTETLPAETPTPEPSTSTPEPTSAATEEPTLAPTATATPTQSAQPEPTAAPTSTPTANPTAEPASQQAAATTYFVQIHSVDVNGQHISSTCYDVYLDAGDGSPGTKVVGDACDATGLGIISVRLGLGPHVLVETSVPEQFRLAANRHFTVSGDRSITVTHQLLTQIVITSKNNATSLPLAGACYDLVPLTPLRDPRQYVTCDSWDGNNDGVTTIRYVDLAKYALIASAPPSGYLKPADREVTVSSLSSPVSITIGFDKGATFRIHKRNDAAEAIAGACFRLFTNNNGVPGDLVSEFCDYQVGPNDGEFELIGFDTGSYFLREYQAPIGYLPVADQLVALTAGQTTEVTITDPIGGQLEIHAVDDHGNTINDICPVVYEDAGGVRGALVSSAFCQNGNSQTDGTSTIVGLPAGNYLLAQGSAQLGYFPSADIPFTIAVGETKTIQIVNVLGGKVLATNVDSTNPETKAPGACLAVYVDAGGGTRGESVAYRCDGNDGPIDGVTSLVGLAAGSYVLGEVYPPPLFNGAQDQTFSIALGETKSLTLSNQPYGTVRIHKKTPSGAALPGSCFVGVWGPGSPGAGTWVNNGACDGSDDPNDGTIDLRLPNGSFLIRENQAPAGYVSAPNVAVEIDDASILELTITDPKPSTLILSFVNVWHDPVTQVCLTIDGNNDELGGYLPSHSACDNYDGATDGKVTFTDLTWGTWTLGSFNLDVYHMTDTIVSLNPGESKTVEVVLTEAPPKITLGPAVTGVTQTSATIYWETDQKMIGSVNYGLTTGLGRTAPSTPEQPTKIHRINLTDLKANTVFYFQVQGTSPNGNNSSQTYYFRTSGTTATGKVVVTKVKSDGTSLPGACFDVYRNAGGGELGTYISGTCDWFEADGNNGKITVTGLTAGHYVLVEFYAPARYRLAKHVLFDLTTGQTKRLTVTNYGGGATVRVTSKVTGGSILKGSCFTIFKSRSDGTLGDYVTNMCDDFDGNDGLTTFSGLAVGTYYLWEDYVPPGYIRDPVKQFVVSNTRYGADITYYNRRVTDTGNIVIKSIDSLDRLVPGACYALFRSDGSGALGSFVKDSCDWSDGYEDGKTYFTGIKAGTYVAVEYIAPKGFIAGKKTTITKVSGQLASKRIRQVAGGVEVRVTTLKGSTTSKAAGACYGLYRYSSGQWQYVTEACDDWDGANDGVTRIRGVQAETYRLYQVATPNGYSTPAYVSITVGTTTKSVTVRMYPR